MDAKVKYMEEWVHKAHDLLLRYNFCKSLLPTAVQHANVAIREGLNDLLALSDVSCCCWGWLTGCGRMTGGRVGWGWGWGGEACVFVSGIGSHVLRTHTHTHIYNAHTTLKKKQKKQTHTHTHTQKRARVPLLIFSAGIADVIEEVCTQQLHHPLPPNVHIVSNRMLFEDGDALTSFTEPVFHVFNKRFVAPLLYFFWGGGTGSVYIGVGGSGKGARNRSKAAHLGWYPTTDRTTIPSRTISPPGSPRCWRRPPTATRRTTSSATMFCWWATPSATCTCRTGKQASKQANAGPMLGSCSGVLRPNEWVIIITNPLCFTRVTTQTNNTRTNKSLAFEEIVRVGFLNDRVEERLAEYQSRFDVVILGDPDVSFVVGLLREIVGDGATGAASESR
jgi:hypothetical protein